MKILKWRFKKSFNLYAITDAHIGAKQHEAELFNKVIQTILDDPHGYCFFNGDNIEMIPPDYGINPDGQDITPDNQFRSFSALLKRLGKKVLFIRVGNHENRIYDLCGINPSLLSAEELGVPVIDKGMAEVQIFIGDKKIRIVTSHGDGYSNSAKVLQNMQDVFPGADLYFTGHTHELQEDMRFMKVDTDGDHEINRPILKVVGGSFLGWADYARLRNQKPKTPGCFVFRCAYSGIKIRQRFI